MIKMFKAVAAAAVIATAFSAPAMATTYLFDSVGDSYTVNFNGSEGGTNYQGLSTSITYTLTGFSNNSATFSYSLDNTSTSPVTAARVTSFGFDVDQSFWKSGETGSTFDTISSGTVSNGLPSVDFCLTSGNNCTGGGNGGESIAASPATGTFKLYFFNQPSEVTLSNLYVRYQGVNTTGVTSGSATGVPTISAVPEPSTWAIMLIGFGGLGAVMRQRRQQAMVMVRA